MPTPGELIVSAITLSIVVGCFTFSWNNFLWFFSSVGMMLIFYAWVVWLDPNNNWPANQPRMEHYTPTKEERHRLLNTLGSDYTSQELDDYHRCYKYNVCVRKFQK